MNTLFVFIIGVVIGSFLNVVGLRLNSGLSLKGRSRCLSCGKKLRWFELIPVFSYLFSRARCLGCKTSISKQYILIEIWTGILFATLYHVFGLSSQFFLITFVFCLYTVILIYDSRHKIIPDEFSYAAMFFSLGNPLFFADYSLLDWLAGPIMATIFFLFWLLSRGRAMGLGDAKLSLSIGILLGAAAGFSSFIVSFWIGALYGSVLLISNRIYPLLRGAKRLTMKSEIPFAPFMIIGAWLSIILSLDLLHVTSL